MSRRSVLRFRHLPPAVEPPTATMVVLHDYRGGMDDLIPLAQSLGSNLRIVAPEAARGVYEEIELVGRTWFGGSPARPEPASFGDSLAQIEQLLIDVATRWSDPQPPFLLGRGQGAALALSLAVTAPDLISGAIAIGGCLPEFSQPGLLAETPSSLPVNVVGDRAEADTIAAIEQTADRLRELGMESAVTWVVDAGEFSPVLARLLHVWLANHAR